jgi:CHASE1-domain containing sensor protein
VQHLSVKIPESLEPVYSNLIKISHKDDEFTLTFLHRIQDSNLAMGRAIVTITPPHAKRLVKALIANVQKYESNFGEIKLPEETEPKEDTNVEVA